MAETDFLESIDRRVRIAQIIVLAMVAGIVLFSTIILTIPGLRRSPVSEKQAKVLTYTSATVGGLALVAAPLHAAVLTSLARRKIGRSPQSGPREKTPFSSPTPLQGDADSLANLYVGKTIISAAFYEGAALFLCVAYMMTRNPALLVFAAVLLAALLWQLPTVDRARRWIEGQSRRIEQDRSTSPNQL